ncbi:MAG: motility protein A [Desulfovibrionaceae bacterium]
MRVKNLLAVLASGAVFLGSFLFMGGLAAYWNLAALLVVGSGLAAATLLSYPVDTLRRAFVTARRCYTRTQATPARIVDVLLDLAVMSRVDGVLALEKTTQGATSSFLRNGLTLVVDNYKEKEIRNVLGAEMAFFQLRRRQCERVFLTMARTAPAFGVAGSVIGLIGLLMGIGDTEVILQAIPVALISTLYGVVLGNLVLAPVAENIHADTHAELMNQRLILEGVAAIRREQNPYKLERQLCAFLPAGEREGKLETLKGITRKYVQRRREREEAGAEPRDMAEAMAEHNVRIARAAASDAGAVVKAAKAPRPAKVAGGDEEPLVLAQVS